MKLEVMAKNVVVGDVLVKGAHKYDVTDVKKSDDLVTIAYATKKSKEIRTLDIEPSVFVKVEQTDEDRAEIAKKAAEKFDKDLHYTLEIEEFGGSYTLEHMCFIGIKWDDRLKFEDLEMKMHFIDPKKIISFKRQHEEETNEVAADPVEETNDKPAEDLNAFYVNVCKEEIEKLENYLADEVDEDHKAFLKSRIENRKIELEFLETGKQPKQETNEVAADPVETVTISPVEVDQFEVRSLVNSYMQWETLEKVAEQKGDDEGKHKCNANKWAIADRAGNVDVHFANAFAKELEQRRKLS